MELIGNCLNTQLNNEEEEDLLNDFQKFFIGQFPRFELKPISDYYKNVSPDKRNNFWILVARNEDDTLACGLLPNLQKHSSVFYANSFAPNSVEECIEIHIGFHEPIKDRTKVCQILLEVIATTGQELDQMKISFLQQLEIHKRKT